MPSVLNKRDTGTYRSIPKGAVYVGRPTEWGNPYALKVDGTRDEVVAKFRKYAEDRMQFEPEWLEPLRGMDLVCWCIPLRCHAEVLLELANA